MKDYYENIRSTIDRYNYIQDKIRNSDEETTDEEDEFLTYFYLYFAHALLKDTGSSAIAIEELQKMVNIIDAVI